VHRELLRIAHEALANALAHAEARHLEVRLRYGQASLELSVRDDGRGFDEESAAAAKPGHFGLRGMRERAAMLGRFDLESHPGRGTEVKVSVELEDLRDG
jgi:signal transduction histidine kinase